MKAVAFAFTLTLLAGCYRPGGGGTMHLPPENILDNQPTELTLTFSVWGSGSGRLDRRYTNLICLYRLNDSDHLHRSKGTVVSADEETMEVIFTIPRLDLEEGDTVTYSFEMLFDGHKNIREGGTLTVKEDIEQ